MPSAASSENQKGIYWSEVEKDACCRLLKYKIVCTMKRYTDRIYLDEYLYGTGCKHTETLKFDDVKSDQYSRRYLYCIAALNILLRQWMNIGVK
jgi:hypothetical protein